LAKAFVVAAPASGSGKTIVTLALLRQLRNRGFKVASAKVGPDYIDPRFHEAATGRPCINLDPWAMGTDLCRKLFASLARGADLVIAEGVMGLFDGPEGGTTADLASMLGLPVVLVIDASHQAQSVAALIHGFSTWRQDVDIAGVILNRVASPKHDALLRLALPSVPVFATLHRQHSLNWPSRHLGLVQAEENHALEAFIRTAALNLPEVSIDGMPDAAIHQAQAHIEPLAQRIAVARDPAFGFTYAHLLGAWREAGAEVMTFSPLNDEAPDARAEAIFLPGGYPELHVGRLAANAKFFGGLRASKARIYGECGGYMVLGDALIDEHGVSHRMAGLLPLTTSFADRKLHLGYRTLKPLTGPWTKPMRGHEFHYSTIIEEGAADRLFEAADIQGEALGAIGLARGNVSGSFAHVICEAT
jgi:cobyrinic acid a,c-diamide synthase